MLICYGSHWELSSDRFSCSVVSDSLHPPWTAACLASIATSRSLLKLMSIESVLPSNHLILCHPLLLPSIFPSIKVFSSESALHIRWPKYWNFSFSISPSNEYSALISFRMDWLNFLAVQGTLKRVFSNTTAVSYFFLSLQISPSPILFGLQHTLKIGITLKSGV